MRLRSARGVSGRPSGGFSLLEVVIASALLLLTVCAVTASVVNGVRGERHLADIMAADRLLHAEAERLRSLPFCAASYPAIAESQYAPGSGAANLVQELFPHALAVANTEIARYVASSSLGGHAAGSFVTVIESDGTPIERVARFMAPGAVQPVDPCRVAGWAVWGESPPPGAVLQVDLSATTKGGGRRQHVLVCTATGASIDGASPGARGR